MSEIKRVAFTVLEESMRLDAALAGKTGLTRSRVKRLIDSGEVLLVVAPLAEKKENKIPATASQRVKAGMRVEFPWPEPEEPRLIAEDIPIAIPYRDEYLAVVEKPPGMVVYPSAGHPRGTLMNAIAHNFKKMASVGAPFRAGVVHRLDKDTSGLMVVALDDKAYYALMEQFKERSIRRSYLALIYGTPKTAEGVITLRIGRSEADRKKMSTRARRGREALTRWRLVESLPGASLIEATLGTGRTHQIRVHLASTGHPVLGDRTYGKKTSLEMKGRRVDFPRQMLHARLLGFAHPITGKDLVFESPLPEDMRRAVEELRG